MSETLTHEIDLIIEEQLKILVAILKPATIKYYRTQINRFLRYLHTNHPDLQAPGNLRRNPHIVGWLKSMTQESPPLANRSRRAAIICVRRLLDDLADNGHHIAYPLIVSQDLPPKDLCLPKPISPEADQLLCNHLRQTDDLFTNALLLIRATGMRIGECCRLNKDSLRHLGGNQWALHVPLGKLHNERWVPVDDDARNIFERILSLAAPPQSDTADPTSVPLLLVPNGKRVSHCRLREALRNAAKRAHLPHVWPHRLRHTYATTMLRAGISLPALKEIMGHRDIRMTMGYVQVTQNDLQREYHLARKKMTTLHTLPQLPNTSNLDTVSSGIPAICSAVDALRHQIEMYRRHVTNRNSKQRLHSLARRLAKLRSDLASCL
jgi:site-specific recombinase XerD